MQEVDKSIYEYDLLPSLYMLNYDGVFVTKNEISEGLATFFNQDRFEKLGFEYSIIAQNVDLPKFAAVWSKIDNDKMKERFLNRNTTIQVIKYGITEILNKNYYNYQIKISDDLGDDVTFERESI